MKPRLRVILVAGVFMVAIIFGLFKNMKTNDIVNGSIGFGKPTPTTSLVSNEEQDQIHKKMIKIVQSYEPLKVIIGESPNDFSFSIIKVEGTNEEIVRVKKKVDLISFIYDFSVDILKGECKVNYDVIKVDKAMTIASKSSVVMKKIKDPKDSIEISFVGSSRKFPALFLLNVEENLGPTLNNQLISAYYEVNIDTGRVVITNI